MWPKTIAYPFQGSVSSSLRMVTMESTSQSCGTEGANVCQAPVSMPRTWYVIPLQGHVSYVKVWTQTHCLCKVNTQKYPWLHKEIFPVLFFLKHKTCLSSFSFSTLESLVKEVFCFPLSYGKDNSAIVLMKFDWSLAMVITCVLGRELQGVVQDMESLRGLWLKKVATAWR